MESAAAVRLLDRGVWYAGYLVEGDSVLLAIDSHGNCLRRVRLSVGVDESCARAWLEGLIEHHDPAPRVPELHIVPRGPLRSAARFYIPVRHSRR